MRKKLQQNGVLSDAHTVKVDDDERFARVFDVRADFQKSVSS